ncbi:MAG: hypothetical protein Q4C22_03675, partial [Bacillota bacterium]|nr:hypothetical protein [Bacillota bacterium]
RFLADFSRRVSQAPGFYQETAPFAQDRLNARWLRMMDVANLPLVSPGARWLANKYQHYLLGVERSEDGPPSSYYIAVPGREGSGERPDGGRSGFAYWQAIKGSPAHKPAYGYWILRINGETGDIEAIEPSEVQRE